MTGSCGWPGLCYLSPARGSEGNAGMWLTVRGFMGREESYKAAEAVVAPSNDLNRAQWPHPALGPEPWALFQPQTGSLALFCQGCPEDKAWFRS